jgi:hypothetical protein
MAATLLDPVAALRCWRIDVDVDGTVYTIPALPAAEWLVPIVTGAWGDIVPGLLPAADAEALDDLIAAAAIDPAELRHAAQAALAEAAGTRWWTARALAGGILQVPQLTGRLLARGLDPTVVSLGGYLTAAYATVVDGMDQMQRARFDLDLQRPPVGVPADEWWDEDAAADNFYAAMGAGADR